MKDLGPTILLGILAGTAAWFFLIKPKQDKATSNLEDLQTKLDTADAANKKLQADIDALNQAAADKAAAATKAGEK